MEIELLFSNLLSAVGKERRHPLGAVRVGNHPKTADVSREE